MPIQIIFKVTGNDFKEVRYIFKRVNQIIKKRLVSGHKKVKYITVNAKVSPTREYFIFEFLGGRHKVPQI